MAHPSARHHREPEPRNGSKDFWPEDHRVITRYESVEAAMREVLDQFVVLERTEQRTIEVA